MSTGPATIGTFRRYGNLYRSPGGVSVSEADARTIVALAEAEGAAVGTVLRRLVRKGLGRKGGAS